MPELRLPSPVERIELAGLSLNIKRDDLIHPMISGNKWRKLKYHLQAYRASNKEGMLSFGGPHSNHLAALAALGAREGISTHALVRGEEEVDNPTLRFCRAQGMKVEKISRKDYRFRDDPEFRKLLQLRLPKLMLIPEGGKGPEGVRGIVDLASEIDEEFETIVCSSGTGTTAAGLLLAFPKARICTFSALKGGSFLKKAILTQALATAEKYFTADRVKNTDAARLIVYDNYHFGGYAKSTPQLIEFMNDFYRAEAVKLDPVYTAKMFFGLREEIKAGRWPANSRTLVIHSGGLQGVAAMNQKLRKRGRSTIVYEN